MMKEGQRAELPPEGHVGALIFDEMSIQVKLNSQILCRYM
jgi:hypothetical protein